jgi:hypothetical protein
MAAFGAFFEKGRYAVITGCGPRGAYWYTFHDLT